MNIFQQIEQRVVLPGDSETRRSQKTISTSLMFAGGLITIGIVIADLSLGIRTAGLIFAGWAVFVLSAGCLILLLPRLWLWVFLSQLLASCR